MKWAGAQAMLLLACMGAVRSTVLQKIFRVSVAFMRCQTQTYVHYTCWINRWCRVGLPRQCRPTPGFQQLSAFHSAAQQACPAGTYFAFKPSYSMAGYAYRTPSNGQQLILADVLQGPCPIHRVPCWHSGPCDHAVAEQQSIRCRTCQSNNNFDSFALSPSLLMARWM